MKKFAFGLLAVAVSGVLYSSAMAQREGGDGDRPAPREGAQRDGAPREGAQRDGEGGPGRGRQQGEGGPGRRPEGGRPPGGPGGEGGRPPGGPGGEGGRGFGGPGGEGGRGFGPPANPVMTALDKDGDGAISPTEFKNRPARPTSGGNAAAGEKSAPGAN